MSAEVVIRPYEPRDRDAVRRICCDTADRGAPVEHFFSDRELIADLVTSYYTDFEPETCWVADAGGTVMGYLTGALDTGRYDRVFRSRILPRALLRAAGRGALFRAETWRMLAALVASAKGYIARGHFGTICPAHLHIDILDGYRGQHVGRRLMQAFLDRVAAAGIRGIHAAVRGDNPKACAFFERMGFVVAGGYSIFMYLDGRMQRVPIVLYGRKM